MTAPKHKANLNPDKRFRTPQGKYKTQMMFKEWYPNEGMYTLHELREKYLEIADPLEYTFATTYFEDWAHWEHLCTIEWFKKEVSKWRSELAVKMQAEGLALIVDEVRNEGKSAFNAAKFLVNKDWVEKKEKPAKTKQPTTTKKEKNEIKELAGLDEEVVKHAQRILN